MDQRATAIDPALTRFAERLRDEIGATRVLLFGSHARGQAYRDSDYDINIVSSRFEGMERLRRHFGLRQIWYAVGGNGPMDLICVTPEEFTQALGRITLIAAVLPESIELLPPVDTRAS